MSWNSESLLMLCAYVAAGDMTASEIGEKLGRPRNSIISKIHRMRLVGPRFGQNVPPPRVRKHPIAAPKPIKQRQVEANPSQVDPPAVSVEPAVIIASTIPISRRVSIMDLGACMCRFMLGDARQGVYCGSRTAGGPWCPGHRAIVSAPPPDDPYRIPRWGRPSRPAEQLEEVA